MKKVSPYKAFIEISDDNQNFNKNLDQNSFDFLLEPLNHTINKDDITDNANEVENNANRDSNENHNLDDSRNNTDYTEK